MKMIDTRQQTPHNPCKGLHAEIRGLNDIIIEKNHEISRHRSTIKHLETNVHLTDREISQRRALNDILDKTRARLNNELGECQNTTDDLKAQVEEYESSEGIVIGNLRSINVSLHETVDERDATIKQHWSTLQIDSKLIVEQINKIEDLNGITKELRIDRDKLKQTVIEKDDRINELNDLLTEVILKETSKIETGEPLHTPDQQMRATINKLRKERDEYDNSMLCANEYIGKQNVPIEYLCAQHAARKKDSDVLKRVVQLVKSWGECHNVKYIHRIHTIIEDRIDAPEEVI